MSTVVAARSAGDRLRGLSARLGVGRFSAVYVWALLIVYFTVQLPGLFLTSQTARSIADSQTVVAIVAIGLLFSLAAGVFDLSIGFTVSLVSITLATLLRDGTGLLPAIVVALLVAVGIGVLNGFVVVVLGIDSFIGTLATSSILQAIAIKTTNDTQIVGLPRDLNSLVSNQVLGVPVGVLYLALVALVAWAVLEHTPAGRQLYAVGSGAQAARLAGIRTTRFTFLALVATSVCAGVAGVILTGTINAASPDVGPSLLLPAFAAAFLGATQVHPGRHNVLGTLIATYVLATGTTGLQLGGAASWVTYMFNGVALVIAVGLAVAQDRWALVRTRRELRRRYHAEAAGRTVVPTNH